VEEEKCPRGFCADISIAHVNYKGEKLSSILVGRFFFSQSDFEAPSSANDAWERRNARESFVKNGILCNFVPRTSIVNAPCRGERVENALASTWGAL
jgi:hypothetical protein